MKFAILTAAIIATIFANVDSAAAQINNNTFGINVIPATPQNQRTETVVITYTELENRFVYLYETVPPATTAAECLAANDFTNLVPIPAERTAQSWTDGKKVVVVMTKTSRMGPCHVIVGRSGTTTASDFNYWRSNFGSTSARPESDPAADEQPRQAFRSNNTPIHKIGRRFPN